MAQTTDHSDNRTVNRRDFIKTSSKIITLLGLSSTLVPRLANALEVNEKTPIIWLHFQSCGGCSSSLLSAVGPDFQSLVYELISLEHHQTFAAASSLHSQSHLREVATKYSGQYILVVEGAIPMKDDGMYCQTGGEAAFTQLKELAANSAFVMAIGSCASWGGVAGSGSNPTGAVNVSSIVNDKLVIQIPGCPPSPYNFISTLVHYITYQKPPKLDSQNRPRFAYGRLIHEQCERRAHFDAGRFAQEFGDQGHKNGYCLYKLGCKGPSTWGNCPEIGFNSEKTWPVNIGHPCFGCIEEGVGFTQARKDLSKVLHVDPPQQYAQIEVVDNKTPSLIAAGAVGATVGGVITAVAMKAKHLPTSIEED